MMNYKGDQVLEKACRLKEQISSPEGPVCFTISTASPEFPGLILLQTDPARVQLYGGDR